MEFRIKDTEELLRARGLQKGGKVQKFIDSEVDWKIVFRPQFWQEFYLCLQALPVCRSWITQIIIKYFHTKMDYDYIV